MSIAANAIPTWHTLSANEVLKRLDSNPQSGLNSKEISRRLGKYGRNKLPEGRKQGPLIRFLKQFDNILVYVLLGAGFIKLMVGLWLDAAIILAVVVINAILGFVQEGKAERALDSIAICCLRKLGPCAVARPA